MKWIFFFKLISSFNLCICNCHVLTKILVNENFLVPMAKKKKINGRNKKAKPARNKTWNDIQVLGVMMLNPLAVQSSSRDLTKESNEDTSVDIHPGRPVQRTGWWYSGYIWMIHLHAWARSPMPSEALAKPDSAALGSG